MGWGVAVLMPCECRRAHTTVRALQAVSSPHVVMILRGAASPLPQADVILLFLLGGLLCHLPVCRGEGGVFCGYALIVLGEPLTVPLHPELALPRQVAIGLHELAVLRSLRFRGRTLFVVVGRDRLMVRRSLGPSHRLLEIERLCCCHTD